MNSREFRPVESSGQNRSEHHPGCLERTRNGDIPDFLAKGDAPGAMRARTCIRSVRNAQGELRELPVLARSPALSERQKMKWSPFHFLKRAKFEPRDASPHPPAPLQDAPSPVSWEIRNAPIYALSASTTHLSDNRGAETRTTSRILKPASRNSCSRPARDTRSSGVRPRPNFPKVCEST